MKDLVYRNRKPICVIVSSMSAKDVLLSTRCLHSLSHYNIYWLTEREFFDILPDDLICKKVVIGSIEAYMLIHVLYVKWFCVFDNDFRGELFNICLLNRLLNEYDGSLSCYEYDSKEFDNMPYVFKLRKGRDDYVYNVMMKHLNKNLGVMGVYFDDCHPTKKLSLIDYIDLLEKVFLKGYASTVVLLGSEVNDIKARSIVSKLSGFNVLNLVGKFDIQCLAHAIKACDIIVSEDNFGLHLALALGIKCIGMYGSTLSRNTYDFKHLYKVDADFDLSCRPCNNDDCNVEENCWNFLDLNAVLESIGRVVKGK